jgi:hypothetical protein
VAYWLVTPAQAGVHRWFDRCGKYVDTRLSGYDESKDQASLGTFVVDVGLRFARHSHAGGSPSRIRCTWHACGYPPLRAWRAHWRWTTA